VPINQKVVMSGDEGMPIVLYDSDSDAAKAFMKIVDRIVAKMEKG